MREAGSSKVQGGARSGSGDRDYRLAVAAVGIVALAIRVQNVARNKVDVRLYGDSFMYMTQAEGVAKGKGFIDLLPSYIQGSSVPTAAHPPGFVTLLAFLRKLGLDTPLQVRYAMCVLGVASVLMIVLAARRMLGRRASLVAGGIAALYPQLWINDGMLMSETFFIFGLTVGFWGVYAYAQDRRWAQLSFAALGFALAASARTEALLMFPLVIVPLVLARRSAPTASRLRHLALAAVFPLAWLTPWGFYNASRFSKPVPVATGFGWTAAQANCDVTYSGTLLGSFSLRCLTRDPPPEPEPGQTKDESLVDAHYRSVAWDYIQSHLSEQPKVVLAREARLWAVWSPHDLDVMDSYVEGRGSMLLTEWARRSYWVLAACALLGLRQFRRRKIPLYPLLALIGITAFVAAITFGNTRYRAGAEVCLVFLATAAIDPAVGKVCSWYRARRSGTSTFADTTGGQPVAGTDDPVNTTPAEAAEQAGT